MKNLLKKEKENFQGLDIYYQDFLKYSLYQHDDSKQKSLEEIIFSLSDEQIKLLETELQSIKKDVLYKSKIHGINHSEKVLFWAFILSNDNFLSDIDRKIVLDAAKYHDIGRTNDIDDTIHGKLSAEKVLSIVDNPIYQEECNRDLLCAIIELHSLDDRKEKEIKENYHLQEESRFSILWKILKDADALDRIRYDLGYLDEFSFNPIYLRTKSSSSYIKASYELCTYYAKKI